MLFLGAHAHAHAHAHAYKRQYENILPRNIDIIQLILKFELCPMHYVLYTVCYALCPIQSDIVCEMSPSRSGMAILVKVYEKYAAEYDIIFNSKKSQLLHFRGRNCCTINKGIEVNGQHVHISSSAVHLGHTIYNNNNNIQHLYSAL